MKTVLRKDTHYDKKSCTEKAYVRTKTDILVQDFWKNRRVAFNCRPFSQQFGRQSANWLVTLSALYFCAACSPEGGFSFGEGQTDSNSDGTFTVDISEGAITVTPEGALPVAESAEASGEGSPLDLVTVDLDSASTVEAEVAIEQEQSVTPAAAIPASAIPVEPSPVGASPAAVVTDPDPAVALNDAPVFKTITEPLISGPNVVGVDYPNADTMWRVDFWVGGEVVNQRNPDGVDQGISILQSEGNDSYTVNIPSGISEVTLYARYWVEGSLVPATWIAGENFIETTVSVTDTGAENTEEPAFSPVTAGGQSPVAGATMTFADIAAGGLSNACYLDDDHYVAEFMYQNPDVCFWELDSANQTVTAVATPEPPSDAVQLPAPSGGDDTGMLESFINARAGESLVGQGTYKIAGLDINVPVDIFNMPMEPASGAGEMVIINSPDVRIFSSPIDGKNSKTAYSGFHVTDGSHRFTLVDSGFSNIYHTNNQSASGVWLRGVDDFHIACNRFENIINDTNDKKFTARANAIWMNGRADSQSTSGGHIVNNYAYNAQSNGKLLDSEFFTLQGYSNTSVDNPVKIFGNRALDAGKRFTKHQEDNAKVLSNDHEWSETAGPLGNRILLAHVSVQFSDNVIARNNRVTVGANSRFDYILITQVNYGTKVQDNIHYDCNDIEIQDQLPESSNNVPTIITARMKTKPRESTGFEATNSSANFNRVHGEGSVRFFFNFDHGYDSRGGRFETIGNITEIDLLNREYR